MNHTFGSVRALGVSVLAAAFTVIGCASVHPVDAHRVRSQLQPLRSEPVSRADSPAMSLDSPEGQRAALLAVLRAVRFDFGTKLTPRQLESMLEVPARSSELLGVWVFEPEGAQFEIDVNAISIDSPIDWLRITMRAELAIHLADLTQLFSDEYDVLRGNAEIVAVEFKPSPRMEVAAELRNDRPAYVASAPVVSVRLRRPGYDPEPRAQLGRAENPR